MLERIITWSLENRLVVLVGAGLLVVLGLSAASRIPIDAFPDTTPVQVQVNTVAAAYSPVEIEQQITVPIERSIAGLPRLLEVRSVSKFGLSQVTALFEDGVDVYFARQIISERLQTVELPAEVERPTMGPVSTGLGEVFHYLLEGPDYSLSELTTIQNWTIKPRLRAVRGVAEVNTWGGMRKQFHVLVHPDRLLKYNLLLDDLVQALQRNNLNVAGGVVSRAGEMQLVQGIGIARSESEIAEIVISARDGVPIRVLDVADVRVGHEIRRGAVTANARGEYVLGLVFMLMGENSHAVTRAVAEEVRSINATLPPGVRVRPVYQRTTLIEHVIATVRTNLLEAALLVIAVLFAFLGNLRAGLIVAVAIPLSMLFAADLMMRFGIAGSLMSLGAIDFGLIVDSGVILTENSMRRLALAGGARPVPDVVRDACLEVRRPTMFGELIIAIVYLPILTLEGIEGRLFRPMALTVLFALLGSMILSLTLLPVLCSLLLPRRVRHEDNWLVRALKWLYRPVLRLVLAARGVVLLVAAALLGFGVWLALRTGAEFVPRLAEEAVSINAVRLAGVSVEESVRYSGQIERLLLEAFPNEIADVWSRTGTAEIATDPMGVELTDIFLTLRPRTEWTRAAGQSELESRLAETLGGMPGMRLVFSQPIEMRLNEMIAGVRSDLGIKIFGDDLETLRNLGERVRAAVANLPGAEDLTVEQVTGQPLIQIEVDRAEVSRFGVPARHVLEMVEAVGGTQVGEIRDGERRFDLVVRLAEPYRDGATAIRAISLATADGQRIPLDRVARIRETNGPSTITREQQKRRLIVQTNYSGPDLAGFVRAVRDALARDVALPDGYFLRFGGQFEHYERAATRLLFVVPLALGLILVLLYLTYRRVTDVVRIFLTLPLAVVGGLAALHLRELPFSISAGVGFIAMSGVAVLGDMVFVSHLRALLDAGRPLRAAIEETALTRLRPVLMTGLVASLGFVPMALSTGVGAEVQRPLATVVIGGVLTSTFLTLCLLPAIYATLSRASRPTE